MNLLSPATRRSAGMTLVELMVAMVVGLILIGGVLQLFVANKATYNLQEELARLQENARFATEMISRDLRQAGYWGCANTFAPANMVNGGGGSFSVGINGTNGTGLNGSDSVGMSGAYGSGIVVSTPYMNTNASSLHVSVGNKLNPADIVLVSDCSAGDVFQISNNNPDTSGTLDHATGSSVSPGNGNSGNLSKTYAGNAQIYKVQYVAYSIANDATTGTPNLYRQDGLNTVTGVLNGAVPLIDGVEMMQVQYGIETDTNPDKTPNMYVNAGSVTNWTKVVTMRIALLMRTINPIANSATAQSYTLLDAAAYTPTDRYLRRVFTTTITLRNRAQ